MDNKNYEPEVVPEVPFPSEIVEPISQNSSSSAGGNYTPPVSNGKAFPIKKIAQELLSTSLNTRSRKILQQFDLQQSGGFQIGNFQEGINGDVRITPNGLTGRNIAGLVTFALDTDGNLVLVGELRSGSTVTGSVIIEEGGYILLGDDIFLGNSESLNA
jgi:hypothetical protein